MLWSLLVYLYYWSWSAVLHWKSGWARIFCIYFSDRCHERKKLCSYLPSSTLNHREVQILHCYCICLIFRCWSAGLMRFLLLTVLLKYLSNCSIILAYYTPKIGELFSKLHFFSLHNWGLVWLITDVHSRAGRRSWGTIVLSQKRTQLSGTISLFQKKNEHIERVLKNIGTIIKRTNVERTEIAWKEH